MNQTDNQNSKASRFNEGKLRWMLLPVECIQELIKILMKGAIKYADNNWMLSLNTEDHGSFVNDRIESAYRHLAAIRQGEIYDLEAISPGSTRPDGRTYTEDEAWTFNNIHTTHAGAVAINALFIVWYILHDTRKY